MREDLLEMGSCKVFIHHQSIKPQWSLCLLTLGTLVLHTLTADRLASGLLNLSTYQSMR